MKTAVVIVAAGRGERSGGMPGGTPKQYRLLAGKPVLGHAIDAFAASMAVDGIKVVIRQEDQELFRDLTSVSGRKVLPPAIGGPTRQASVMAGLVALEPAKPEHVLIHDAARPFITGDVIGRVIDGLQQAEAVLPAVRVSDTLKRAERGIVTASVNREGLWAAQTPQGFHFDRILAAHRAAADARRDDFTDDTQLIEWAGGEVSIVEGSAGNVKLTSGDDFALAEGRAGRAGADIRSGTGFDVHAFCPGDHVWLCGVRVPHGMALAGHSDADVGLHALTDALLGAIGDGDIGAHFPPSDPRWKGAASHLFLADAAERLRRRGGRILNVDVTLICEAPKIGPHRDAMRARVAEILGIPPERVGVKATTTEGLGFTGRREGIAATAIASVAMP
ncbi:MAG: bifunctional 2-C-methyl-D-erythritol 4-phosphate cytidylyltransferase/2-C-methyl-D-erythritol 2,4-cyclodiphosphate synthase [Pseudomonadota bacterium]|nr:bifunctional 2-C-methyl-D-erythritol 4-phosphate cytidylyltransferase/2-C-methyl-D-erythritol 2,4-cyclodiphosphate synthase [Pseudomonadota bacterium]